jgi:hypothetical protein
MARVHQAVIMIVTLVNTFSNSDYVRDNTAEP